MKNGKIKVAIIGIKGFPAVGGSARSTEYLVDKLKEKYDLTLYTVSTHTKNGHANGVKQVIVKGNSDRKFNTLLYYVKSMVHCVIKGDYDLIHINHLASGFIVPALKLRYKVIGTDRGVEHLKYSGKKNKWTKSEGRILNFFASLFLRYCDMVVTVSKPALRYYEQTPARNKIKYIPNGIEVNGSLKKSHNAPHMKYKDYILFSAGRIINLKGCHLMLSALRKIGYTGKVVIIGDLEHDQDYKKYIHSLAESLDVEFPGLIHDKELLFRYIQNARLFVFPSYTEGMSNMLLEAVYCKAPIIASDIPENRVLFDDDEMVFFRSGSVDDLSEKIVYGLNNKPVMSTNSEKAFARLLTDYNMDAVAQKYDKLYRNLVNDRP